MGYIGNQTSNSYTSLDKQTITGDGGASYTLDHAVANEQEIEVFVNNVRQEPSVAYTVSGTALTMTGNVESSDDFYVVFQGKAIQTTSHPEGQDLKARDGTFSGDIKIGNDTDRTSFLTETTANLQIGGGVIFEAGSGNNAEILNYRTTSMVFGNGGSEDMRIDSSGNVGIGTTSPSHPLHVSNSSGNVNALLESTGSSASRLYFNNTGMTNAGDTQVWSQNNDLAINTGGSERMRIDSAGRLNINDTAGGTATFGAPLIHIDANSTFNGVIVENHRQGYTGFGCHADNNTGTRYALYIVNGSNSSVGSVSFTSSATSFNTSSDHRLKENVEDMTGAITRIKQLQPRRFSWIIDDEDSANVDGFIAHEAQTVVPEAVTGTHNEVDDDGNPVYQGIDQAKLVPLLTGALQEAIAKIEALETRVQALEDA